MSRFKIENLLNILQGERFFLCASSGDDIFPASERIAFVFFDEALCCGFIKDCAQCPDINTNGCTTHAIGSFVEFILPQPTNGNIREKNVAAEFNEGTITVEHADRCA